MTPKRNADELRAQILGLPTSTTAAFPERVRTGRVVGPVSGKVVGTLS